MMRQLAFTDPDTALQDYLDSCYSTSHSLATVHGYKTAIAGKKNGFRRFLKETYGYNKIELCNDILEEKADVYQVLQRFIVFLDKEGFTARSIKHFFFGVKGYLTHLGVEIYSEKCKQRIRLPKIIRNRRAPYKRGSC